MHPLVCTVPIQRIFVSHIGIAIICFSIFLSMHPSRPIYLHEIGRMKIHYQMGWFVYLGLEYIWIYYMDYLLARNKSTMELIDGMWLWIRVCKNLLSYGLFAWKDYRHAMEFIDGMWLFSCMELDYIRSNWFKRAYYSPGIGIIHTKSLIQMLVCMKSEYIRIHCTLKVLDSIDLNKYVDKNIHIYLM